MRSLLVALVFAFPLAPSVARAQPVTLVLDEDGARRTVELEDARLLSECATPVTTQVITGRRIDAEVVVGGRSAGRLGLYVSAADVFLPAARPGEWCRARPELLEAIARTGGPSSRGPWLAFIGTFGALAIAIGLVAMWGHGRGPRPEIEASAEDEHH